MRLLNNLKTGVKLIAGFTFVAVISLIIAFLGYFNMKTINDSTASLFSDRLMPIAQLGAVNQNLYTIRGDIFKALLIPDEAETSYKTISDKKKSIDSLISDYKKTYLLDSEVAELAVFEKAWIEYQGAIDEIIAWQKAGNNEEAIKSVTAGGRHSNARKAVGASAEKLMAINVEAGKELYKAAEVTFNNSVRLLMIIAITGFLLAVVLGVIISSSISKPLGLLVNIANSVSNGDLVRDLDDKTKDSVRLRNDEVGDIGKAFDRVILYMQSLGDIATRVASNDLTVAVSPKSDKDEVGHAFVKMLTGLNDAVSQVAQSALNLATASGQLASAAGQAGQATTQIATTVQEVAKGITQQSSSVSQTASSVEQMGRAISGVAAGAQEQAAGITKASTVTARLNENIQKVAGNAEAVTRDSGEAAKAARAGTKTVEETIQGMQNIKAKVGLSSQKVLEMGTRSEQIGLIVETIEDIASQTNLLALNAAIEAARAGEHGKGFAVVADEVRKLAERASSSTKEIGALIKEIQKTVAEAVSAMQDGANEVETGVRLANSAGDALSDILRVAEAVYKQSELATAGVLQMRSAANDLVAAVDSVSAVIEENTASTEEMAAGANEVTRSIETIASISEESSASIEEVSASAEEMSAQVEEVNASAQSLAEMAEALQQIVQRFKLQGSGKVQLQAEIDTFKKAHLKWFNKAEIMQKGGAVINPADLQTHKNCALGQWYYGIGLLEFGKNPDFLAVESHHKQFHDLLREYVNTFNGSGIRKGQDTLYKLQSISASVVEDLDWLKKSI